MKVSSIQWAEKAESTLLLRVKQLLLMVKQYTRLHYSNSALRRGKKVADILSKMTVLHNFLSGKFKGSKQQKDLMVSIFQLFGLIEYMDIAMIVQSWMAIFSWAVTYVSLFPLQKNIEN